MNLFVTLISSMPVALANIYVLTKINKMKLDLRSNLLVFFLLTIVFGINTLISFPIIRPIISYILFFIINKTLFKKNTKLTLLYSFYTSALFLLAEIVFVLIVLSFLGNIDMMKFSSTILGCLISNSVVSIISIILINFYGLIRWFPNVAKNLVTLKTSTVLLLLSLLFVSINVLFFMFYYEYVINAFAMYIIIAILFVVYTVIMLFYMKAMDNYNQVKERYTVSLKSLIEYEKILERYRVETHENKNHLNIIGEMKDIKDVEKYVKTMLNKVPEENEKLLNKVSLIPEGGLRAVFYTKLMLMEESKIDYGFKVGRKIHVEDFIEMDDQCLLDICNIINVFLDNAIHSTILSSKPMILIDVTSDEEEIEIFISNSYEGEVKLEEVKKSGYTTNGDGHGYGLTLVNETLKKNNRLTNETIVKDNIFNQILRIKIKDAK